MTFVCIMNRDLYLMKPSRVQRPIIRACIINGDLRGLMGGRSGRVATQLSVSSSSIPTSSLSGSLRVRLKNLSVDFLLGFHEPARRKSSVFVFLCRTLFANFCISMTHKKNTSERKTGSFIFGDKWVKHYWYFIIK